MVLIAEDMTLYDSLVFRSDSDYCNSTCIFFTGENRTFAICSQAPNFCSKDFEPGFNAQTLML